MQAYITNEQLKYFKDNRRMDFSGTYEEKLDEWNDRYYYQCMRQFLLQESLSHRRVKHRFQGEVFLSVIPPQSIASPADREFAFEAVASFKESFLPAFEKSLWKSWEPIEASLLYTDADPSFVFAKFMTKNYFRIMKEVVEAEKEKSVKFEGLRCYEMLSTVSSAVQGSEGAKLLEVAPRTVLESIEIELQKRWDVILKESSDFQRELMPLQPTAKYVASIYFKLLKKC